VTFCQLCPQLYYQTRIPGWRLSRDTDICLLVLTSHRLHRGIITKSPRNPIDRRLQIPVVQKQIVSAFLAVVPRICHILPGAFPVLEYASTVPLRLASQWPSTHGMDFLVHIASS
jgi:hypothetical protein